MADEPDGSSSDIEALGRKLRNEQDGSPERDAYLRRLRELVKSGEYVVDAEALADKILEVDPHEILPDHCGEDEEAK